jgi:hypothetical protein
MRTMWSERASRVTYCLNWLPLGMIMVARDYVSHCRIARRCLTTSSACFSLDKLSTGIFCLAAFFHFSHSSIELVAMPMTFSFPFCIGQGHASILSFPQVENNNNKREPFHPSFSFYLNLLEPLKHHWGS